MFALLSRASSAVKLNIFRDFLVREMKAQHKNCTADPPQSNTVRCLEKVTCWDPSPGVGFLYVLDGIPSFLRETLFTKSNSDKLIDIT
jgi:hypothetical protein